MSTIVGAGGGGLWSVGSSWVGGIAPTNNDDVVLDATSGNITLDGTQSFCRSLDCTGYTGTLLHKAGNTLVFGNGTNYHASNLALKLVPAMTYTVENPLTSKIQFGNGTIGVVTPQELYFGGKITGNITFPTNYSFILMSDLEATRYFSTIDVQKGVFNSNGFTINTGIFTETTTSAKTLTFGSSVINCYAPVNESFSCANASGLTITANTATVNIYRSPTSTAGATYLRLPNGMSNYLTINMYGGGILTVASAGSTATCKDVNFYGAAPLFGITDRVQMNASFAVTGTVSIYGYSATRRIRVHNGGDFYIPNATALYCEYTDFQSVNIPTYVVDLSASIGGAGNLGGNSNIIFTPAITCYWYQTVAGVKNWTDASNWFQGSGGTGGIARMPLPQDTARFDANSFTVAGCIVRGMDSMSGVFRLGGNIDWTGVTNNPTWDFPCDVINYGSLTLSPNMNITAYSDCFFTMGGTAITGSPATFTLDTGGLTLPFTGFFVSFSTSLDSFTLLSDYIGNSLNTTLFQVSSLLSNFNNKNVTVGRMTLAGATVTLGNGLHKLKGTGTVLNTSATTITATTCTIEVESTSTVAKTIAGGSKVYGNLKLSGNFNDAITFTGNNTWTDFDNTKTSEHTLLFTAGSTNTFTGNVTKTTGSLWNLMSTTTSIFTWSKASGTVHFVDAIISKSTASGGATFTADTDCINGGGNTGWTGFVTNPFTWTNTDLDNAWDNPNNWFGGNVPSTIDKVYFTGEYNQNCTLMFGTFGSQMPLGITLTAGYTGVVTNADTDLMIGLDGLIVQGGTFTFGAFSATLLGRLLQTGGTLNMPSTGNTLSMLPQGSAIDTINTLSGTFNHNGGYVTIDANGIPSDVIINNNSTRPLFSLVGVNDTIISGTFFVDSYFQLTQNGKFNGDCTVKALAPSSAVVFALTTPSDVGTGILRLTGSAGYHVINAPYVYNLQLNSTVLCQVQTQETIVLGNLTLTSVSALQDFGFNCKGNISTSATSIAGGLPTKLTGDSPEQQISGSGVLTGDTTINKDKGMVKMLSNMVLLETGRNLTITKGQLNTNECQLVLLNNLTIGTSGALNKTLNSTVQVNGTLSGSITKRQRAYADGCMA